MIREVLKALPILGPTLRVAARSARRLWFRSPEYWERRYAEGGSSGPGSYGLLAEFKAQVLNDFVYTHNVRSVIDFGCGDGNQLSLARYPEYIGVDISPTAVELCRKRFAGDTTKTFTAYPEPQGRAELALSQDVIFHLTEDHVFETYMRSLFGAATRYVAIYSDDTDYGFRDIHVRHRCFSNWIAHNYPDWSLIQHTHTPLDLTGVDPKAGIPWSDFYIYERH